MAAPPKTHSTLFSVWLVLIGVASGIFTGLFLGDYAAVLRPVGDLYAMLLEVAVYPYLICSLLHGLGRLTPVDSWRLFRAGWIYYAGLMALVFAVLIILGHGIPAVLPAGYRAGKPAEGPGILELLIPSDPFSALSNNYVPAVILFSVFFGIALQHVKEKEPLLAVLETVRLTSLSFWNGVVPFAPLAVFALFSAEAGVLRVHQVESLLVFLLLFFAGTVGLALWILPAILAALLPIKSREVLGELRAAFTISVVTTLSVAALPFITQATERLADRCGIADRDRNDVIRTNLSVAYPFGQLGNFFVYLFLVFASGHFGVDPGAEKSVLLPIVSLFSCVGSPTSTVDAVQFLSAWLGLPATTTTFYVALMALTRYGQVLLSVAGFGFLSFTVVLAYYGKMRVRWGRLAAALLMAVLFAAGAGWLGLQLSRKLQEGRRNPYLSFSIDPALVSLVKVLEQAPPAAGGVTRAEDTMVRIQRTGELRVGYNDSIIPFCYRNAEGQLCGYDVAFAYRLASDLNVNLRFIPFEWPTMARDLDEERFDIAMAGIYVTSDRLEQYGVSQPYFQSPLALFMPRASAPKFHSRAAINALPHLRIGVFNDPVLLPRVKRTFPNAEIVLLPDYRTLPDFSKIDAAIWTFVQAEALAAAHPDLIAVAPTDAGNPYLLAYLVPQKSDEFVKFINYWLTLKQADGFEQAQRSYWIDQAPRIDHSPRWSILRNVLGFGATTEAKPN